MELWEQVYFIFTSTNGKDLKRLRDLDPPPKDESFKNAKKELDNQIEEDEVSCTFELFTID